MTLSTQRLLDILEGRVVDYTDEELEEAEGRSLEVIRGHELHTAKPGRREREPFVPPTFVAKSAEKYED